MLFYHLQRHAISGIFSGALVQPYDVAALDDVKRKGEHQCSCEDSDRNRQSASLGMPPPAEEVFQVVKEYAAERCGRQVQQEDMMVPDRVVKKEYDDVGEQPGDEQQACYTPFPDRRESSQQSCRVEGKVQFGKDHEPLALCVISKSGLCVRGEQRKQRSVYNGGQRAEGEDRHHCEEPQRRLTYESAYFRFRFRLSA